MKCSQCGNEIEGLCYLSPIMKENKQCRCMECMKKDKDYIQEIHELKDLTYCTGCHCMTHSTRKGRAKVICSECGNNKTLGDYYQYELNGGD